MENKCYEIVLKFPEELGISDICVLGLPNRKDKLEKILERI